MSSCFKIWSKKLTSYVVKVKGYIMLKSFLPDLGLLYGRVISIHPSLFSKTRKKASSAPVLEIAGVTCLFKKRSRINLFYL